MATVNVTITKVNIFQGDTSHTAAWTPLTNTNTDGSPVEMPGSKKRCVQVTGTFGAGGSVRIQGSNDGSTYAALHDAQGNALDITAAGIKEVLEVPRYIRPLVTAGDGTTSLTVTLMLAK